MGYLLRIFKAIAMVLVLSTTTSAIITSSLTSTFVVTSQANSGAMEIAQVKGIKQLVARILTRTWPRSLRNVAQISWPRIPKSSSTHTGKSIRSRFTDRFQAPHTSASGLLQPSSPFTRPGIALDMVAGKNQFQRFRLDMLGNITVIEDRPTPRSSAFNCVRSMKVVMGRMDFTVFAKSESLIIYTVTN